jgi:hypothetical protein
MANQTSQHILGTAATLLGFCLIVITAMDVTHYSDTSLVDEFTSVISLLLISSCMFSFLSLRTTHLIREKRLETTADYLFVSSLSGILIIVVFIAFHIIK